MEFIDLKAQYHELESSIDHRIKRVLEHGQFIMGPEVAELEGRLSKFVGTHHCVTVSSGTEALLIALMSLGIGPGDEVITTPFTFVATTEVIVLLGAKPVFVDIEPDTCNIDAALIEAAITQRTKAILPVSLYGQPADMDQINSIASRHGLPVIEDAAQSFGASYRGKPSGALSSIGCTSFFPSKPLGCYGDGGAIFCDDANLVATMCEIRIHGQSARYCHTRIGVGGRMDTLQCAIVLAKLERFAWECDRRIALGARYDSLFANRIRTVTQRDDRQSIFGQYTIFVDERDQVQQKLRDAGIPTAVHYPRPVNRQAAYIGASGGNETPIADRCAATVMSLPMHPYLDDASQDRIVAAVLDAVDTKER